SRSGSDGRALQSSRSGEDGGWIGAMKHLLQKSGFGATYETPASAEDRCLRKGPWAMTTTSIRRRPGRRWRISLRDERFAGLLWQIVVVAIAVAIVAWLWSNAVHNLS